MQESEDLCSGTSYLKYELSGLLDLHFQFYFYLTGTAIDVCLVSL